MLLEAAAAESKMIASELSNHSFSKGVFRYRIEVVSDVRTIRIVRTSLTTSVEVLSFAMFIIFMVMVLN